MPTLIKLLKLACTVLAFPNNALTENNNTCPLILKRNNRCITYFSVVMHGWVAMTLPPRYKEDNHIPYRDLFTTKVHAKGQSRPPETVIPWLAPWNWDLWEILESGYEPALLTAVTLFTHVQKLLLNLNECAHSNWKPRVFGSGFLISSRASSVRSSLIPGTRLARKRFLCFTCRKPRWAI